MKIRQDYAYLKLKGRDIADELIIHNKMRKQICEDEFVCRCPACEVGFLHLKDPIERIGQCDCCFEEIKILNEKY